MNFKVDDGGVLRLTVAPKGAAKSGKEPVGRKKKGTPLVDANGGVVTKKRGRKPRLKTPHTVCKGISPTIPNYFHSSVPPKNTACTDKLPEENQVVPSGSTSAEAEALKELQDIENMLTIYEQNDPKTPEPVGDKKAAFGEEGDGPVCKQDGVHSKWVESVLGDINEIEG